MGTDGAKRRCRRRKKAERLASERQHAEAARALQFERADQEERQKWKTHLKEHEAACGLDFRNNVRELHFSNVAYNVSVPTLLPFLERYGSVETLELYKNNRISFPGRAAPTHCGNGYVIFKSCESVFKITEGCSMDGRSWILPAPNVASTPRAYHPLRGCLKMWVPEKARSREIDKLPVSTACDLQLGNILLGGLFVYSHVISDSSMELYICKRSLGLDLNYNGKGYNVKFPFKRLYGKLHLSADPQSGRAVLLVKLRHPPNIFLRTSTGLSTDCAWADVPDYLLTYNASKDIWLVAGDFTGCWHRCYALRIVLKRTKEELVRDTILLQTLRDCRILDESHRAPLQISAEDASMRGGWNPILENWNLSFQVEYSLRVLLSQGKLHCQHLSATFQGRLHDLLAHSEALAVAALQHLHLVLPPGGIATRQPPEDILMAFVDLKVAEATGSATGAAADTSGEEEPEEEKGDAPSRLWAGRDIRGSNVGQVGRDWWRSRMEQLADVWRCEGLGEDITEEELNCGLGKVGRIIVTPTRILHFPMEADELNRVLRKYQHISDRFIRVSFSGEVGEHIVYASKKDVLPLFFDRMKACMLPGIGIGGRRYEFLAYSSSQLKELSVWLFAPIPGCLSTDDIRRFMGDFSQIRCIGKAAARMGQCFSSTVQALDIKVGEEEHIEDVKTADGEYCFSDGIGRMSLAVCTRIADRLRRLGRYKWPQPPSAVQIRYKGCKGMLTYHPALHGVKIQVRPSMTKFAAEHAGLEICEVAQRKPAYLNQQVITLLAAPNGCVPDEVFIALQETMTNKLDAMVMTNEGALEALPVYRGLSGDMVEVALSMLHAGFDVRREPFLYSLLVAARAALLKDLRKKTRILVPQGACLLGVMDEEGVLGYGQVFLQVERLDPLRRPGDPIEWDVMEGDVVVAKNPCFHPGDVRVLRAVDVPALRHLRNVLVFPQVGPRPHPNELSGSDLDGDSYFVSWNPDLLPPLHRRNPPAGSYPPVEPKLKPPGEPVTSEDLIDFFIDFAKNDNLGVIAKMHLRIANTSPEGAWDGRCLDLAELHSTAVDFPKSGVPADYPHHIFRTIKHHPDFMEIKRKDSVECQTVIGQLYRMVKAVEARSLYSSSGGAVEVREAEFDEDLIMSVDDWWDTALEERREYEVQLMEIMNHYGVHDEAQLVGGAVPKFSKFHKNQSGRDVRQQVNQAVSALWRKTLRAFHEDVAHWVEHERGYVDGLPPSGDHDFNPDPLFLQYALEKASAWYIVTYDPVGRHDGGSEDIGLRSFPWVAAKYLTTLK